MSLASLRRLAYFLVAAIVLGSQFVYAEWLDRKAEGWAWYEERQEPQQTVRSISSPGSQPTAAEQIAEARASLDEKLSLALLKPTEENVRNYILEQRHWVERSAEFSATWAQVLLQYPELDPTAIGMPMSQYGLDFHKQELVARREELIASLSQHFGLMFFYEGSRPASDAVAQVVKRFSERYGWAVLAVAVDGQSLPYFDHSREGLETAHALGLEVFPALVAVSPETEELVPLAYGLVTLDQIEQNIAFQFQLKEENHE